MRQLTRALRRWAGRLPQKPRVEWERSRRLGQRVLPADRARVPRDHRLRGATPQAVLGDVLAWLVTAYPFPHARRRTHRLLPEPAERVLRRLLKRSARWPAGPSAQGRVLEELLGARANYLHELGLTLYHPQITRELSAATIWERALGARTVAHEYWHSLRRERPRFFPFEEGAADLFATVAVYEMTGADTSGVAAYPELAAGAQLLSELLGGVRGLMGSRAAPDQSAWLRGRLSALGAPGWALEDVLRPIRADGSEDALWYHRVESLYREVKDETL